MSLCQKTFALLLALTPGMGGRSITRVLARNALLDRSPAEFLSLSSESMVEDYRLSVRAATRLVYDAESLIAEAEAMERRLVTLGVALVTSADAHYPSLIEELDSEPPGILFLYGNARLLEGRTFTVLASRRCLPADLDRVERLTEAGVLAGEVLVTGHDTPEYQRAAVVPLRWGAPRVLCLDRGLFRVLGDALKDEAFRAARLWRYQFDAHTDLAISPFRPEADYVGVNNQVRDRLVASLSRRIDFAQLQEGGNMERLARMALRSGRPVRVSDLSPIARRLEHEGASLVPEGAATAFGNAGAVGT
jgi:predicted Rossmann fold nucleotide-binding protein DprA/Smf involved in DNA uptake